MISRWKYTSEDNFMNLKPAPNSTGLCSFSVHSTINNTSKTSLANKMLSTNGILFFFELMFIFKACNAVKQEGVLSWRWWWRHAKWFAFFHLNFLDNSFQTEGAVTCYNAAKDDRIYITDKSDTQYLPVASFWKNFMQMNWAATNQIVDM